MIARDLTPWTPQKEFISSELYMVHVRRVTKDGKSDVGVLASE